MMVWSDLLGDNFVEVVLKLGEVLRDGLHDSVQWDGIVSTLIIGYHLLTRPGHYLVFDLISIDRISTLQ